MHLQESGEMYLETIYVLSHKMSVVHAIDVSEYMGYSKPSVSRAIGLLRQGGFVVVDNDGGLHLTPDGHEIAKKIYQRHTLLTDFFISIGVNQETATLDACKIEHHLSDESYAALEAFLKTREDT